MKCKKCGTSMIIDEWNGWVWACFNCDNISRKATNKEISIEETKKHNQPPLKQASEYTIGQVVKDEDGHIGRVVIYWDDGDICEYQNDAAHPNPQKIKRKP